MASGQAIEHVYGRLVELEASGMAQVHVRDRTKSGAGFMKQWRWVGPKP